jgi:hypothetical protein
VYKKINEFLTRNKIIILLFETIFLYFRYNIKNKFFKLFKVMKNIFNISEIRIEREEEHNSSHPYLFL